jgi:Fe-S-cluster containining protein
MSKEEKAILDKVMPIPPYGKGKEYCEYLDRDGKCSVYEQRPIICRAFGTINSPFLKCKHVEGNIPSKELEKELYEYGVECNRNGVSNQCAKEDDIITKVKEGDLEAIRKILITLSQMFLDKTITEEDYKEKIGFYNDFYRKMKDRDLMSDLNILTN